MPESKLLGRLPDGRTRAAAGHELAERVALAAQGVEERGAESAPVWRALPFEGPFVVGDQIGVTGHDLMEVCRRATVDEGGAGIGMGMGMTVWEVSAAGDAERVRVEGVLEGVLRAAQELAGVL
jgi:hypothetical protein